MCINSFASWASALITIIFSGGALCISILAYRYARKKDIEQLKLSISTCILGTQPPRQALMIDVVNTGHRKIIVTGYHWVAKPPFKAGKKLLTWMATDEIVNLSVKVPTTLEEGATASYLCKIKIFQEEPNFLFSGSKFLVWLTIKSLHVEVVTTRKRYSIRVSKGLRALIWSQYKHLQNIPSA